MRKIAMLLIAVLFSITAFAQPDTATVCEHIYGGEYHCDEESHWKSCIICNTDGEKQPHKFSETEDLGIVNGTRRMRYICSVCGYSYDTDNILDAPMMSSSFSNYFSPPLLFIEVIIFLFLIAIVVLIIKRKNS